MKKSLLLTVTLLASQITFASTPTCKELLKSAIKLNRLSIQNISAVQGNLKIEAQTINQWANQIDRATRNNSSIDTRGMKANSRELIRQSTVLESYLNSIETELQLITDAAIDCE